MSLNSVNFDFKTVRSTWQRLMATNKLLTGMMVLSAFLVLASLVASVIDSRLVAGAPVWIKPMKFAISFVLYCGTLVWMLSYVRGKRLAVSIIGAATVIAALVELAIIFFQAARGVRSHFNFSTPLDGTLFNLMGAFVILIWVMNLVAAVLLLRQKMADKAFAWSLRLGLLVTFVGAGSGYFMTVPTPDQLERLEAGQEVSIIGAHSVGVADGGAGLPFLNWSTEGGDVRAAHFVGLHALQAIPLLGLAISRFFGHLNENRRAALVLTAGSGYLGLVLLLLWQALRGQPLIAPDALTLAALAGLISLVVVTGGIIVTSARWPLTIATSD